MPILDDSGFLKKEVMQDMLKTSDREQRKMTVKANRIRKKGKIIAFITRSKK